MEVPTGRGSARETLEDEANSTQSPTDREQTPQGRCPPRCRSRRRPGSRGQRGDVLSLADRYGGRKAEEARRLRELAIENARLERVVADVTIDNQILWEANEFSGKRDRLHDGGVSSLACGRGWEGPSVVFAGCSASVALLQIWTVGQLRRLGSSVLTVWEFELRRPGRVEARLTRLLAARERSL